MFVGKISRSVEYNCKAHRVGFSFALNKGINILPMRRKMAILLFGLSICTTLRAEEPEKPLRWDLKSCIDYALAQNIQVKKSHVALEQALVDTKTARAQLFPSLSLSASQSLTDHAFSKQSENTSSTQYSGDYGLNASWNIFNGGKLLHSINQQKLQENLQRLGIEESKNDIQVAVIEAFLQVLYADESVKVNRNTVEVSQAQLERAAQLLQAGALSRSDYAQLESQLAADKYQLVMAQTTLDQYKLQLKQLLELDISEEMELDIPSVGQQQVMVPLPEKQEVYRTSLEVMPEIKSGKLAIEISQLEEKKARAGYFPTLSLNAGIGTGHLSSSQYRYWQQVRDNFSENIGLTLSIPIFRNRSTKSAVQKAQLSIGESRLDLLSAEKTLLKTVESVYLDAVSSREQFASSSEKLSAVNQSYKLVEEQFNLGMKNTLELLTEKNNLLSAQQQQLQSKYMAVLSNLLLDFYQGKPVVLD